MFRNGVNTEVYAMGSEVVTGWGSPMGGLIGHRHVSMSRDSTQGLVRSLLRCIVGATIILPSRDKLFLDMVHPVAGVPMREC